MDNFLNPLFEHEMCTENDTLMNEVLMLRETISKLEHENNVLKNALHKTQALKIQLETSLLVQGDGGGNCKMKKKRLPPKETRAFSIFINEQRSNNILNNEIRAKMKSMGYNVHHQKKIPYQFLKLECDMLYEKLSATEKQKYIDLALGDQETMNKSN